MKDARDLFMCTCMISTAMPCVATFSTVFISQCTTSALMKQLGVKHFCSGSNWTPVLRAHTHTQYI